MRYMSRLLIFLWGCGPDGSLATSAPRTDQPPRGDSPDPGRLVTSIHDHPRPPATLATRAIARWLGRVHSQVRQTD